MRKKKNLNRHSITEDTQMVNKHVKNIQQHMPPEGCEGRVGVNMNPSTY